MVYILMALVPALAIVVFILHRPAGSSPNSRMLFYAKGKAAGFSRKEIGVLRRIAVRDEMGDQTAVFGDPELLGRCIRTLVQTMRAVGDRDPAGQDFLARLYEYRKKIELGAGQGQGITSSRQMSEGQNLRVVIGNSAMYYAKVIRSGWDYLLITRPANPKLTTAPSWLGQKLAIYFWREEDAGYVFDCEVLDEVYFKGIAAIQVSHSLSLFRTQKRKSIRAKTHKPAYLYILKGGGASTKLEAAPGLKSIVEDLSDTGCAVTIGGKANPGMRVKLQFSLNRAPLSMSGVVRSVDFTEGTNRSLLHIEADPIEQETKNAIFGEVFGVRSQDEDFISFHLAEQELRKKRD
ncbi:type IV pilus assembly protein PilZ [Treponema primitia ZAS-2]|uniref:Type IV pilus assembly protein PilZ n=2 Tax=Treponema primitia TaxID=88058 RepID=F5YIY9_TREPZ|nr:type IV pilus assembly protein PilZ [Treponema primitia ZAS-2]